MKMAIIAALTLIPAISAQSQCYTLYNPAGKMIYAATTAPFDLSGPPDSPAYAAAKAKGIRLVISTSCPKPDGDSNAAIMSRLAESHKDDVTAHIVQMQNADAEREDRQQFIDNANHELYRRGKISAKQLKFYNDIEEREW